MFPPRPADITRASLLKDHEVWVDDEDRPECEQMRTENCLCHAEWLYLIEVLFADDDGHRSFGASYTAITGLPNAFSAVPTSSKQTRRAR